MSATQKPSVFLNRFNRNLELIFYHAKGLFEFIQKPTISTDWIETLCMSSISFHDNSLCVFYPYRWNYQ